MCGKSVRRTAWSKWHTYLPSNHFWRLIASPVRHLIVTKLQVGGAQTGFSANRALACVTRAILVIFVVFVVSEAWGANLLAFVDRMYIRHFRHCRQDPLFLEGAKTPFAKTPVCVLPNKRSPHHVSERQKKGVRFKGVAVMKVLAFLKSIYWNQFLSMKYPQLVCLIEEAWAIRTAVC